MQRTGCRLIVIAGFVILTMTLLIAGSASASSYKSLHEFSWAHNPIGNLVRDTAGNLYGTTTAGGGHGCGIVFKMKPNLDGTWTYSILYGFKGSVYGPDGCEPQAGVTVDKAGNLYGTTVAGGANAAGIVFRLKPNADGTWSERVLYNFELGSPQFAGVVLDTAGNLYGTTYYGGSHGWGSIFKLVPSLDGSWSYSVLYSFEGEGASSGAEPMAGLIFDAAGNLYGTASTSGGPFGPGVVFRLAPNPDGSWTYSVLHSFSGADGENPQAGLIMDASGNLYGTTVNGGGSECGGASCGVAFKLTHDTWTESVLHSFTGGADGMSPQAGLTFHAGDLYGTTFEGATGCGVVFRLTPASNGWSETVLHTFLGCGCAPWAGLIFDPAGNLYGTTEANYGLVFEIRP